MRNRSCSSVVRGQAALVLAALFTAGSPQMVSVAAEADFAMQTAAEDFTDEEEQGTEGETGQEEELGEELQIQEDAAQEPVTGRLVLQNTGEVLVSFSPQEGFIYQERGLEGAVYEIYGAEDALIAVAVTGEDGSASVEGLSPGTYRVKEREAPEGYFASEDVYTVTLSWETDTAEEIQVNLSMKDERVKASLALYVYQLDEDGVLDRSCPVEGAEFELRSCFAIVNYLGEELLPAGSAVAAGVTGADGSLLLSGDLPEARYMQLKAGDDTAQMYYLEETGPAPGYLAEADTSFYTSFVCSGQEKQDCALVKELGSRAIEVELSKRDLVTKKALPGASLQLLAFDTVHWKGQEYSPGSVLEEWTSTELPHRLTALPAGSYILREITAPYGYQRSGDVVFQVRETAELQQVVMEGDHTYGLLALHKYQEDGKGEPDTDRPMGQVEFQLLYAEDITDQEGNLLFREGEPAVTAEGEAVVLVTDEQGYACSGRIPIAVYDAQGWNQEIRYRLVETRTPAGYAAQEPTEFTFFYENDSTPVITLTNTIVNEYTKVEIGVLDQEEQFMLPGVRLQVLTEEDIYDDYGNLLFSQGQEVREWITQEKETHFIRVPGGSYRLKELEVPTGYVRSEDILFYVLPTGEVQSVMMEAVRTLGRIVLDTQTEKNEPLSGIMFRVINKDTGQIADELITDENGCAVSKELPIGRYDEQGFLEYICYELIEAEAPNGYVQPTGGLEIQLEYQDCSQAVQEQQISVINEIIKVELSRQESGSAKELPGAMLCIAAVEGVEYRGSIYRPGEVIEAWISQEEPHYMEYLPAGSYVLSELAAPEGCDPAESMVFTVYNTGEIQKVAMVGKMETAEEDTGGIPEDTAEENTEGVPEETAGEETGSIPEETAGEETGNIPGEITEEKIPLTKQISPDGQQTESSRIVILGIESSEWGSCLLAAGAALLVGTGILAGFMKKRENKSKKAGE